MAKSAVSTVAKVQLPFSAVDEHTAKVARRSTSVGALKDHWKDSTHHVDDPQQLLDDDALHDVLMGNKDGSGVRILLDLSYDELQPFMEDHEHRNDRNYVDFRKAMKLVEDGKGGMVWVRKENVEKWRVFNGGF